MVEIVGKVDGPRGSERVARTLVVILTSTFFGLYLWGLDLAFDRIVNWIFRQFGA